MNNSGDRILVEDWENLLVFDTSDGTHVLTIPHEHSISSLACCHRSHYVVGHAGGSITVWDAVTGLFDSPGPQRTRRFEYSRISHMICFNGSGDRPHSCISLEEDAEVERTVGRLFVWDVITREIFVEFDQHQWLDYLFFGCTASIIITAVQVWQLDTHTPGNACKVNVWEVEKCEDAEGTGYTSTSCTQTLWLNFYMRPTFCFHPAMNALFCLYLYDDQESLVVISLVTEKRVARIKDFTKGPRRENIYDVKFLQMNEGVILL